MQVEKELKAFEKDKRDYRFMLVSLTSYTEAENHGTFLSQVKHALKHLCPSALCIIRSGEIPGKFSGISVWHNKSREVGSMARVEELDAEGKPWWKFKPVR